LHSKNKFEKLVHLVGFNTRNKNFPWQSTDYKLPEDDTIVSKHVGM